ncbi:MAG: adenylate/guanylate cyclase domain-containing protein [Ilumatobacteraceae bacterium]
MSGGTASPPTGDVTFLFTDLEGSTGLWERDPDAMQDALAEHDRRLTEAVEANSGYVFTTAGDSFAVAFASPAAALAAAIDSQVRLAEPCGELALRIRIGIHTGNATIRDGDYFGAVVNRCARLMAAGHGGQILVSGATEQLLRSGVPAEIELVDRGEHRLKDLLRPEQIFQVRHPDLGDGFAPLRTLEGPQIDLPVQLTTFVGRERELAEVKELLAQNRLVTLTGSGGAGKTRLSYQVAAESAEDFPDGIRVVEGAPVTSEELIYDEIAAVVGALAVPDRPVIDTIADRIGGQRLLIVLDNAEHLVDAVAELVGELLVACQGLKLLVTSRERLLCPGEAAYRVPALTMPGDRADLAEVLASDSVRLFSERAMLARPDFTVTEDNASAVAAICRRLDGIPLALELAAARVRVLSPAQIVERLDERFELLGGASRGAVARHRTLVATIDWSYEHLSEPEQAVFRRASVFAGDFDLGAAEAICAGDDVPSTRVIELVTGLVDKSMLVPEETDRGEVRYRLLETMRHYGAERLTHDSEVRFGLQETTRDDGAERLSRDGEKYVTGLAHVAYYAGVGETLQAAQRAGEIGAALAGLDREIDNLRGALRFALDEELVLEAARIVGSVGYLWYASGLFREGIEWCRELFAADPELPDELLAAVLHAYGTLLGSWAQPEAGLEMMRREVELRRRIGDPARLAAALNNLGNIETDLGHLDTGEPTLREAAEQFRTAGEPATMALASLGHAYKDRARYNDGAVLFAEALDEAAAAGDSYGMALSRSGLGECAIHSGRLDDGRRELNAARESFTALGVSPGTAHADMMLALADLRQGADGEAAGRLARALEDPDAHWYQSTKFWVLQLAAGITEDRTQSGRLIGVVERHYDETEFAQPTWVLEELTALQDAVRAELGSAYEPTVADGRRSDPYEAIDAADRSLRSLAVVASLPSVANGDGGPADSDTVPGVDI